MNDADLLADLNALLSGSRSQDTATGDDGGSGDNGDGTGSAGGNGDGGNGDAAAKAPLDEEALRARLRALEDKVNAPFAPSDGTE